MTWKTTFFSAATLFVLAAGSTFPLVSVARASGCEAPDRIDGTTAEQAKAKIEHAGFRQVSDLKKGCDNFWHGVAVKDGAQNGVVLTPQGQVMPENQ